MDAMCLSLLRSSQGRGPPSLLRTPDPAARETETPEGSGTGRYYVTVR